LKDTVPDTEQKQQAMEGFKRWAESTGEPVQLSFPISDIVRLTQNSLGELLRRVGQLFIETVMEAEVEQLAGPAWQPRAERKAYRWGSERGYCIVDGQRVPIRRPRVRTPAGREIRLGSYETFQQSSLGEETVWINIMHGLTMRNYKEVVQQFVEAYGLEKSTVSEHFIAASRRKLEKLMNRSLDGLSLVAIVIDGMLFKGAHVVVAIGIDALGHKIVLGLQQGATENAPVVVSLFDQLSERGVDFSVPRLYLLDGSRALNSVVRRYCGQAAFIQRCQVHKLRNVAEHVPESHRRAVKFRMRAAYQMRHASDARQLLFKLHEELVELNPTAAASLAEGLEDTLTVIDLDIERKLCSSLSSTNSIESSFSIVERICHQVKRWHGGDHRLRWVGSALLYAESRWSRIRGYGPYHAWSAPWKVLFSSVFGRLNLPVPELLPNPPVAELSTEKRTSSLTLERCLRRQRGIPSMFSPATPVQVSVVINLVDNREHERAAA
jgi:putative transposase